MKKYIKSSFGYYDSDWIDPPEDDFESLDGEIVIEFNNDEVKIENEELEFVNYKFTDFDDPDYNVLVATSQDIEEAVYEALIDYQPELDGTYHLSGWVAIPYTIDVPVKGYMHRRDWEEIEPNVELSTSKVAAGEIKFNLVTE